MNCFPTQPKYCLKERRKKPKAFLVLLLFHGHKVNKVFIVLNKNPCKHKKKTASVFKSSSSLCLVWLFLFLPPQEPSKDGSGGSSKAPKSHKLTKEHRERPRKDSESKAMSKGDDRDGSTKSGRDPSSSSSSSSKKPSDIKAKEDVKVLPKAAFKEPKLTLKESKMEGMSPKGGGAGSGGGGGGGGGSVECKAPGKRPSTVESPKPSTKKQKKGSSEGPKGPSGGAFTGTSPRVSSSSAPSQSYSEKKPPKDKSRWAKSKNDSQELKESKKPPDSEESNSEDEASSKSEVRFSWF